MEVSVNGERTQLEPGTTLAELLERRDNAHRGVAVAVDGELVRRGVWAEHVLTDGARLEVLSAVPGG